MNSADAKLLGHLDTAYHEAGHALACLLERRPIGCWQILADQRTQINRRMRLSRAHSRGIVTFGGDAEDLLTSMSGFAGEDREVFLSPDVQSYQDLLDDRAYIVMSDEEMDDPRPQTDEEFAWSYVELAHDRLDGSCRPGRVARCVRYAYSQIRELFEEPDFVHAVDIIAGYMLGRSEEMDPQINNRMLMMLDTYGCTKDILHEMRRKTRALDLPGIVRRFAHPRLRSAA